MAAAKLAAPMIAAQATQPIVNKDAERREPVKSETPLMVLAGRGRLTSRQNAALRSYGVLFRTAQISDAASIKSCIAELGRVPGGGIGLPAMELETAEWIAACRAGLVRARSALGFHTEMILVCDLICGRGHFPRDITKVQREAEEIETTLRLAGDLLARHFDEEERHGRQA